MSLTYLQDRKVRSNINVTVSHGEAQTVTQRPFNVSVIAGCRNGTIIAATFSMCCIFCDSCVTAQDDTIKSECVVAMTPTRVAVIGVSESKKNGRHSVITQVDIDRQEIISQFIFPFLHFEFLRAPDLLEASDPRILALAYESRDADIRSAIREVNLATGSHLVLYSSKEDIFQVPLKCLSGTDVLLRSAISSDLAVLSRETPTFLRRLPAIYVPRIGFCVSHDEKYAFHGRDIPGLWKSPLEIGSQEGARVISPVLDKYVYGLWMSKDNSQAAFTDGNGKLWTTSIGSDHIVTKVDERNIHTVAWSPDGVSFVFVHTSRSGVGLSMWDGHSARLIGDASRSHITFLPTSAPDVVFIGKDGSLCRSINYDTPSVIVPASMLGVTGSIPLKKQSE